MRSSESAFSLFRNLSAGDEITKTRGSMIKLISQIDQQMVMLICAILADLNGFNVCGKTFHYVSLGKQK